MQTETTQTFEREFTVDGVLFKDETTYSRGDMVRKPKVFTAQLGNMRISIVYGHIRFPDQYVFHCFELNIDSVPMRDVATNEGAAMLALATCRKRVVNMLHDLKVFPSTGQIVDKAIEAYPDLAHSGDPVGELLVKERRAAYEKGANTVIKNVILA